MVIHHANAKMPKIQCCHETDNCVGMDEVTKSLIEQVSILFIV